MKKVALIVGIVIVFAVGIGAALFAVSRSSTPATTASSSPSATSSSKSFVACDVLTQSVAESLLGKDITKADAGGQTASTNDISVSNCSYLNKIDSATASENGTPKTSGVMLVLYTPKNQSGITWVKTAFNNQVSGTETVKGIGDKAFYNTQFKQLHILKGNNWYDVTYFKDSISNSSLDLDKEAALKLHFK